MGLLNRKKKRKADNLRDMLSFCILEKVEKFESFKKVSIPFFASLYSGKTKSSLKEKILDFCLLCFMAKYKIEYGFGEVWLRFQNVTCSMFSVPARIFASFTCDMWAARS